jgi:bacterioferritin (cytochrome b1)
MLLTREEMSFDFGGARLDPLRDRELLGWIFNQFLYGEVTGIQCGHWLYNAPDLEAARFLARQSLEEMQHIDNFLRILTLLGCEPRKPHAALRFLATGMMGADWAEHVTLEMAQGEGFVLMALYALIDTLDHAEIVSILERAVRQEERHVDFGERRTVQALRESPALRHKLLGLSLVSILAVRQLARHLHRLVPGDHPVTRRLPDFLRATLGASELRLTRMGLLDRPLAEITWAEQGRLIAGAYAQKALERLRPPRRPRRLTDTYLEDPALRDTLREMEEAIREMPLGVRELH